MSEFRVKFPKSFDRLFKKVRPFGFDADELTDYIKSGISGDRFLIWGEGGVYETEAREKVLELDGLVVDQVAPGWKLTPTRHTKPKKPKAAKFHR